VVVVSPAWKAIPRRIWCSPGQGHGVREYLVENFGFDDSQLKTLGWASRQARTWTRIGVRSRFSSSLWLVNRFIPMQGQIKSILNGLVVVVLVLWIANLYGLFDHLRQFHVGH
jgi:hypothetical protein